MVGIFAIGCSRRTKQHMKPAMQLSGRLALQYLGVPLKQQMTDLLCQRGAAFACPSSAVSGMPHAS